MPGGFHELTRSVQQEMLHIYNCSIEGQGIFWKKLSGNWENWMQISHFDSLHDHRFQISPLRLIIRAFRLHNVGPFPCFLFLLHCCKK